MYYLIMMIPSVSATEPHSAFSAVFFPINFSRISWLICTSSLQMSKFVNFNMEYIIRVQKCSALKCTESPLWVMHSMCGHISCVIIVVIAM